MLCSRLQPILAKFHSLRWSLLTKIIFCLSSYLQMHVWKGVMKNFKFLTEATAQSVGNSSVRPSVPVTTDSVFGIWISNNVTFKQIIPFFQPTFAHQTLTGWCSEGASNKDQPYQKCCCVPHFLKSKILLQQLRWKPYRESFFHSQRISKNWEIAPGIHDF